MSYNSLLGTLKNLSTAKKPKSIAACRVLGITMKGCNSL